MNRRNMAGKVKEVFFMFICRNNWENFCLPIKCTGALCIYMPGSLLMYISPWLPFNDPLLFAITVTKGIVNYFPAIINREYHAIVTVLAIQQAYRHNSRK